MVLCLLAKVGFVVNHKKLSLVLAQRLHFLGFNWTRSEVGRSSRRSISSLFLAPGQWSRIPSPIATSYKSFLVTSCQPFRQSLFLSPFPLSSAQPEQHLPDGRRQFALNVALGQVSMRSLLDSLFGASSMRFSNVVSPSQRLQHGGGDGCIRFGLGPIFPGPDASGPLVGHCRCPRPYRCEGTHGVAHLPLGLPSLSSDPVSLFWRTNCTATCPKYGKKVAQYLNISFVCDNSIGTSGSFLCLGRFSGGGGARRAGPGVELSVPSPSNFPSRHSENSQALSPRDSILASPSLVSGPAGLGHCGRLLASGDASSVGPVDGVTPTSLSPPCLANFWRL